MRREEDTSKTCKIGLTIKEKLREGRRPLRTLHSGWKQPSNRQKMAEKLKKTAATRSTTISKQPSARLAQQPTIKFFLMSVSTSTPKSTSENEFLLPANNTALILDSLSKVLETHAEGNVLLVFDGLSELLMLAGFERTYRFLRYALDMLPPATATTLFLLNPSAHEPKVVSHLKELFSDQLAHGEDGLKIIRVHD